MDERDRAAVAWLLASDEPAIRVLTRRRLLGERIVEPDAVMTGDKVRALLSGQQPDGGFGVHPYRKWTGAHWRLVSLVELGAPSHDPRLHAAAATVLDWLTGDRHRRAIKVIDGLTRRCASQEGNALAVCCRLGMAAEPRVERLARDLVGWQWPDGGWNCDERASGRRSSFHETLIPAWGLHEYWAATGRAWARDASVRAAELLLSHRLFRSLATGDPIDRRWLRPRYPPYWHYDILQALLVLARMDVLPDPRAADALELLRSRRRPDGCWTAHGSWWRPPSSTTGQRDVVDWGRTGPNEMITLNALTVLSAAAATSRPRRAAAH
jgi:hypothetical protein